MPTSTELEQRLEQQQRDYLSRLEKAGQLPTIISQEWNKAGGTETTALRGQEAELLKNYVSAGAEAREKYKDVWNPFSRDVLASKQVGLNYAPIASIRNELAMRAEALGVATTSATSMYQAGTQAAETGLGFTQDAYSRALAREEKAAAEATALAKTSSKSSGGGGGGGGGKQPSVKEQLSQDIQQGINDIIGRAKPGQKYNLQPWATEQLIEELKKLYGESVVKGGYSDEEIKNMVYDYRKPLEKDYYF
jgi:hypothetical protein